MKNSLIKLILLNVITGIILLIIFYLSAFLSGYGSNITHLSQEKRLFIKFAIFHCIVNIYLLYKLKQINTISIFLSIIIICCLYLFAAWQFEYF